MQRRWTRRFGVALAVLALGSVVLTGCGDDDEEGASGSPSASEAPAGEGDAITVTATDYKFDMPDTLEAGVVTVDFVNDGEKPHELGLARLAEELDAEAFG